MQEFLSLLDICSFFAVELLDIIAAPAPNLYVGSFIDDVTLTQKHIAVFTAVFLEYSFFLFHFVSKRPPTLVGYDLGRR